MQELWAHSERVGGCGRALGRGVVGSIWAPGPGEASGGEAVGTGRPVRGWRRGPQVVGGRRGLAARVYDGSSADEGC